MTTPYDVLPSGEKVLFKDTASLVLNNRLVAMTIAAIVLFYQVRGFLFIFVCSL